MRYRRRSLFALHGLLGCSFALFPSAASLAQIVPSPPSTNVYYFGGGGERGDDQNQFDLGFTFFKKVSDIKKWDTKFQIDVAHPTTKKELTKLPATSKKNISEFSSKNFEAQMSKILRDLKNGKPKPGDQLLIAIDTHGFYQSKDGQNLIETTDGNAQLTEPLKQLIHAAKNKGVKIGIILANCYSGDIVEDFGETKDVCIISASAPGRIATTEFNIFFEKLGVYDNLEDVFLRTRNNQTFSTTQPSINTPEGFRAARDLDIFRNYKVHQLDFHWAAMDQLCENTPLKLARISELGRTLSNETQRTWFNELNKKVATEFRSGIEDLKWKFDNIPPRPSTGTYGVTLADCLSKQTAEQASLCTAIHSDADAIATIKKLSSIYKSGQKIDPTDTPLVLASTIHKDSREADRYLQELEKKRQSPEVTQAMEEVARKKAEVKNWNLWMRRFAKEAASEKLVSHERRLYDELYRHYTKEEKNSNACRDFKLK